MILEIIEEWKLVKLGYNFFIYMGITLEKLIYKVHLHSKDASRLQKFDDIASSII